MVCFRNSVCLFSQQWFPTHTGRFVIPDTYVTQGTEAVSVEWRRRLPGARSINYDVVGLREPLHVGSYLLLSVHQGMASFL